MILVETQGGEDYGSKQRHIGFWRDVDGPLIPRERGKIYCIKACGDQVL